MALEIQGASICGLQRLCLLCMVKNLRVLQYVLDTGIPFRFHSLLFTAAAEVTPMQTPAVRHGLRLLVSTWPKETFKIRDLLPEMRAQSLLLTGVYPTLLDIIVEGVLCMRTSSKLKTLDFRDVMAPNLFALPLLSQPEEERNVCSLFSYIQQACRQHDIHEDEGLESVLTWKLEEIIERNIVADFNGNGRIDILTQLHINLTDWISMGDGLMSLVLQNRSPFQLRIFKLKVDNFHLSQKKYLRMLLSLIDPQSLGNLTLCAMAGRKTPELIMWHFQNELKQFQNLKQFSLETHGPCKYLGLLDEGDPGHHEIMTSCCDLYHRWHQLGALYFNRIVLTRKLEPILKSLRTSLCHLTLYHCYLDHFDISYLTESRHITSIEQLSLEWNMLKGCGPTICVLLQRAVNLRIFNLKDTELEPTEKLAIMETAQCSRTLETLAIFESEDMLSAAGYEQMVTMACKIPTLHRFYLYPFSYKPFEVFCRSKVRKNCESILEKNGREDLKLFY